MAKLIGAFLQRLVADRRTGRRTNRHGEAYRRIFATLSCGQVQKDEKVEMNGSRK
jgi:hypothetical protein